MSTAGQLKPSDLATVQGVIHLGKVTASWWRQFEAQLSAASGIKPQLTSPDGGYRTASRQRKINPAVAPASSDHCKGRGIDLYNQREFRNWNEARFLAIAKANGFQFYVAREPWHARNIKTSAPAAAPVKPIIMRELDVSKILLVNKSSEGEFRGDVAIVSDTRLIRKHGVAPTDLREAKFLTVVEINGDEQFANTLADYGWADDLWRLIKKDGRNDAQIFALERIRVFVP